MSILEYMSVAFFWKNKAERLELSLDKAVTELYRIQAENNQYKNTYGEINNESRNYI